MQITQRDYLLRLIEEVGAGLRRLRAILVAGAPPAEVLREARSTPSASPTARLRSLLRKAMLGRMRARSSPLP